MPRRSHYLNGGASANVSWGASAGSITSPASDGENYYVANATGIYKGLLPSGSATPAWNTVRPPSHGG